MSIEFSISITAVYLKVYSRMKWTNYEHDQERWQEDTIKVKSTDSHAMFKCVATKLFLFVCIS